MLLLPIILTRWQPWLLSRATGEPSCTSSKSIFDTQQRQKVLIHVLQAESFLARRYIMCGPATLQSNSSKASAKQGRPEGGSPGNACPFVIFSKPTSFCSTLPVKFQVLRWHCEAYRHNRIKCTSKAERLECARKLSFSYITSRKYKEIKGMCARTSMSPSQSSNTCFMKAEAASYYI